MMPKERKLKRILSDRSDYDNVVTVYNFEADTMMEYPFGEEVPAGIYEGFSVKVQ